MKFEKVVDPNNNVVSRLNSFATGQDKKKKNVSL